MASNPNLVYSIQFLSTWFIQFTISYDYEFTKWPSQLASCEDETMGLASCVSGTMMCSILFQISSLDSLHNSLFTLESVGEA